MQPRPRPAGGARIVPAEDADAAAKFVPKRSQGHGVDGPNSRRIYDGLHLAVLGNALWTPAQKNKKETSGCRSLSSKLCGKLSGSPFVRTTSRKRNGRSMPSFSSGGRCKRATVLRGLERSGVEQFQEKYERLGSALSRSLPSGITASRLQPVGPLRWGIGPQRQLRAQRETDTLFLRRLPPKETQWSAL